MPDAARGSAQGRPGGDEIYHVPRDSEYLSRLRAEQEFWDTTPIHIVDSNKPPPALVRRYSNARLTGDAKTEWFETIPRYGSFTRGLMLGTGNLQEEAAILRSNPSLQLTFLDISGKALARRERELSAKFPGRVATQQLDLNFTELPKDAYDVVISDSTMHHLLNLEHIASQINESLTANGLFFYHDYVGEARLQFAEEKKRLFEAVFRDAQSRHAFLRRFQPVWSDPTDWKHSPFEAIRSDETLDVFGRYLTEVSVRTTWPLFLLLVFLKPKPLVFDVPAGGLSWRPRVRSLILRLRKRLSPQRKRLLQPNPLTSFRSRLAMRSLLPDLLRWDGLLTDAGIFRPCRAFAIYRKRASGDVAAELG